MCREMGHGLQNVPTVGQLNSLLSQTNLMGSCHIHSEMVFKVFLEVVLIFRLRLVMIHL